MHNDYHRSFQSRANQIMSATDPVVAVARILNARGRMPLSYPTLLDDYERLRRDQTLQVDLIPAFDGWEIRTNPKS